MTKKLFRTLGLLCLCTMVTTAVPMTAMADVTVRIVRVGEEDKAAEKTGTEADEAAEADTDADQTGAAKAADGTDKAVKAADGTDETADGTDQDAEDADSNTKAAAEADSEADPEDADVDAGEDGEETTAEYQTSSGLLVRVDDEDAVLYETPDVEAEIIGQVETGATYTVLEQVDDQWVKISAGESEGYLNTVEAAATVAETAEEVVVDVSAQRRQEIVDYALQFVGNRYVYGGTNPNTGADCSGFTSYVMRHSAGVELSHSSAAQANQGRSISSAEMRPGDLICYSSGKRVNHVALYIGNGQIVHASNERNGIRISQWNYRTPARIVNVLGD